MTVDSSATDRTLARGGVSFRGLRRILRLCYGKLLAKDAAYVERFEDFMKLFSHTNGTVDQVALKNTLEAAKDSLENGGNPKIYLKGIESVHPTGY